MTSTFSELPGMAKDPSRLLASRIDFYAQENGSRAWASIPRTNLLSDGFRDISYAELARAVNRASWWLDECFGSGNVQCFAYVGPKDFRYSTITVAAIKTGRTAFFPSPLLSRPAVRHLLKALNCDTIFFGTPTPKISWLEGVIDEQSNLQMLRVPSIQDWFNDQVVDHKPYKYSPLWDDAIDEPVLILHSSGTTGMPKSITYRNSTLVYFDTLYQLGLIEQSLGRRLSHNQFSGKRIWIPFPMAHLGGLYGFLLHPIYLHTISVMSPDDPLDANLSDQMILHGNVSSGYFPPVLLDDIATKPDSVQLLSQLDCIQWGTAPLSKKIGEFLCTKVHMNMHFAMTELPFPPYFELTSHDDWNYMLFHPYCGVDFHHRSDDLHEMVFTKKDMYKDFQPVFTILPDADHFDTGDLWSPHPTKAELWTYRGRIDDIISLSNGIHMHTQTIELAIEEDDRLRSALVGGEGRSRPYLLLELTQDAYNDDDIRVNGTENHPRESLVEALWPSIEAQYKKLGIHHQVKILKEQIIVVPADRPFRRLPKGSVDRKGTIDEFCQEIDALYADC